MPRWRKNQLAVAYPACFAAAPTCYARRFSTLKFSIRSGVYRLFRCRANLPRPPIFNVEIFYSQWRIPPFRCRANLLRPPIFNVEIFYSQWRIPPFRYRANLPRPPIFNVEIFYSQWHIPPVSLPRQPATPADFQR